MKQLIAHAGGKRQPMNRADFERIERTLGHDAAVAMAQEKVAVERMLVVEYVAAIRRGWLRRLLACVRLPEDGVNYGE